VATRTSVQAVKDLLTPGGNYDLKRNPSLAPFVATASALVDAAAACMTRKGLPAPAATLELMERWLAAHCYTRSDALYSARTTQGASGQFVRPAGDPESFKLTALELDPTGCLSAVLGRRRASAAWLGKTVNEQLDYEQRGG
jgi:hypothetical protein